MNIERSSDKHAQVCVAFRGGLVRELSTASLRVIHNNGTSPPTTSNGVTPVDPHGAAQGTPFFYLTY